MKTHGKARLILPDIIVINGKMYKLTVRSIYCDGLSDTESIEKHIVLEEVKSEDEP